MAHTARGEEWQQHHHFNTHSGPHLRTCSVPAAWRMTATELVSPLAKRSHCWSTLACLAPGLSFQAWSPTQKGQDLVGLAPDRSGPTQSMARAPAHQGYRPRHGQRHPARPGGGGSVKHSTRTSLLLNSTDQGTKRGLHQTSSRESCLHVQAAQLASGIDHLSAAKGPSQPGHAPFMAVQLLLPRQQHFLASQRAQSSSSRQRHVSPALVQHLCSMQSVWGRCWRGPVCQTRPRLLPSAQGAGRHRQQQGSAEHARTRGCAGCQCTRGSAGPWSSAAENTLLGGALSQPDWGGVAWGVQTSGAHQAREVVPPEHVARVVLALDPAQPGQVLVAPHASGHALICRAGLGLQCAGFGVSGRSVGGLAEMAAARLSCRLSGTGQTLAGPRRRPCMTDRHRAWQQVGRAHAGAGV